MKDHLNFQTGGIQVYLSLGDMVPAAGEGERAKCLERNNAGI